VLEVLPNADKLTLQQLRNSLPDIMDQMAEALESEQPAATLELIETSKPHGKVRFHQHYNIEELLAEYRMWRRILIEEVWRGLDTPPSEKEVTALNMAVDTVLGGGLLAYTDNQKMHIEHAVEIESRYLAYMSHDLRNHLNHATLILTLHTQSLKQMEGFEETVKDVEAAQQSIHQTIEGMNRLLQAERLRRNCGEPKRVEVNLQSLASDIAGGFAHEANEKGLTLEVRVPAEVTVRSDPGLIQLVLQNLIGNAVKYSQRGAVQVDASFDSAAKGWVISVSDQGPGIAANQIAHLFDAFTRGSTQGQAGFGLGLSVASGAAKALGGELKVESKFGEGTTFSFLVPEERA